MNSAPDPRATFDAALIPGMRDRLADYYDRFRASEAEAVRAMATSTDATSPRYLVHDCRCCGAASADVAPVLQAHGLDLLDCPGCGLTYSRQVMDEAVDAARYEMSLLDREAMRLRGSPPYLELETARDRYYLSLLMDGAPPGRLLEIGSGTGTLLLEAERLGWRALGIEPGVAAAEMARRRGARIAQGWFPADLPADEREFDAVCLLDVLEHFADPVRFLGQLGAHLAPGGRLFVQVPNWDSPLIRLQGAAGSTVCPGHWSYFTPATLTAVAARAGFRVLRMETVVSQIDLIAANSLDRVQEWVTRLRPKSPAWPFAASALLDLDLGYKLIGVFAR